MWQIVSVLALVAPALLLLAIMLPWADVVPIARARAGLWKREDEA